MTINLVLFSISGIALVVYAAFAMYVHARTVTWYEYVRVRGDAVVIAHVGKIQKIMHKIENSFSFRNTLLFVVQYSASGVAYSARVVERWAHQMGRVAAKRHTPSQGMHSSFLEKVTTHKQSLNIEQIKKEAREVLEQGRPTQE